MLIVILIAIQLLKDAKDSGSEDNTPLLAKPVKAGFKNQNEITKRQVNQSNQNSKVGNEKLADKKKEHKQKPKKQAIFTFLLADFMHNFVDGVALGVAFNFNIKVGISTLLAEFFHELPHEIGDFAVLIKKGYSISTVLLTQLITALGALIGGLIGIYIGAIGDSLIGFTAGGFLYLALGNMVPEILDLAKTKGIFEILTEIASMSTGMYLMYLIAITE